MGLLLPQQDLVDLLLHLHCDILLVLPSHPRCCLWPSPSHPLLSQKAILFQVSIHFELGMD